MRDEPIDDDPTSDDPDETPLTDGFVSTRRRFVRTGVAAGLGTAALGAASTTSGATLSNPNATEDARRVYRYLQEVSGSKILSAQEYEPWGIDEMQYIQDQTGRQPAIMGLDFINENFQWRVNRAIEHWNAGGIVTIMWHWGAPTVGPGYQASKATIDVWRCFEEGTAENEAMYNDLDQIAEQLATLRDRGIPVIWRPMHECNGGWFWWSKSGADAFIKLWRTVYDYFTNEWNLDNLIWVLGYADNPDGAWDPGPDYYDIAGADTYNKSRSVVDMYEDVVAIHGDDIPIAFHECGTPPDPSRLANRGAWWTWWMNWHTDWLTDNSDSHMDYVYNHDLTLTLDDVDLGTPPTTTQTTPCEATPIIPYLQVDGGSWQSTDTVTIQPGSRVRFGPHPTEGGSWSWSGPNLSAATREVAVTPTDTSTYTATYTNSCGAESILEFTVTVDSETPTETPTRTPEGPTWPTDPPATDPDGDGLYEDLSGDGTVNFPDVNTLFQNSDTANVRENAQYYDFESGDGITLQDVMALFQLV